jgi:hypothetical protein
MKVAYLKRVIWPAVYITAVVMGIWSLVIGGLTVALIATGDESVVRLPSLMPIPAILSTVTLLTVCLLCGHTVYKHSNGEDWLKFRYLLPRSFS